MAESSFDIRTVSPDLKRAIVNAFIAGDLFTFVRMVFETVVPGEFLNPNWHIRAMAYALERVMRGEIRRLIITMPPRNLKSLLASVALHETAFNWAFLLSQLGMGR